MTPENNQTRTWEDVLDGVIECVVTLWQLGLVVAVLPIILFFAAVLVSAPLWLGYMIWGVAIDIYRHFTRTPELPQQLCALLGLW